VQTPVADGVVWTDPALLPQPSARLFDPAAGTARAAGSGRGTVWFVPAGLRTLVLRHYRRGGLMGRLIADRYLREPPARSRAMAEFALLQRMAGWDLAVPRAAGARWQRAGAFYRADILVERIPGAEDLSEQLQQAPLPAAAWQAVGAAIARLHAAGVCHADLNCHNLMRDAEGRVWIIDFDKCEVRAPGPWQQANLERLRRSLRKERGRLAAWHWAESDWPALLAGYESGA
jgi:tRNA A-37 threonylcarbamoyl transferase component Bud32